MKKQVAKKRIGRPPKKSGKLDLRFNLALDRRRKSRYQSCAVDLGVDLSEWIRRACDAAADEHSRQR